MGYETKHTPCRRILQKRTDFNNVKRRRLHEADELSEFDVMDSSNLSTISHDDIENCPEVSITVFAENTPKTSTSTQYDENDLVVHNDHSYAQPWADIKSSYTQTNETMTAEKGVQITIEGGTMSANANILTDSDSLLYTGVNKQVFFTLVETMAEFNTFSFKMKLSDQIMLVLMRLKLHLIFDDLSRRFGISTSLACKIFNTWIPVLADKLKGLVAWLPRETIRACCPESFKENYHKTTCIIDCAETFIQRPTNLKSRCETFSNYKSHNTAKYLVGISPHGQIMFISKAFGGRASDKFIVEKSGFLNYLLPGDEIMVDRGFTIDDLLFPLRVKLNIPAFTKCKPQLSARDLTSTRRIARVRIHVERAIRRLKMFKILSSIVAVSSLKLFDDMLLVCSALVNLRGDLIRERLVYLNVYIIVAKLKYLMKLLYLTNFCIKLLLLVLGLLPTCTCTWEPQ
ncbi:hypothetical protein SNE40_008835 [Patella caerulea]|uniref:DDE Tnp4 domain-containing protein n=1 Tax=Patella caerulea TaxID=87958 RepID=A0AAN8JU64_PATCE